MNITQKGKTISDDNPLFAELIGLDTFDKITFHSVLATKNSKSGVIAIVVDPDSYKTAFTEEYTTQQTGTAIITPTPGYRICVRNVHIQSDAVSGEVQLDFVTSGKKVARLYLSKQSRDWFSTGCIASAVDEPLTLTTTTGTSKVFVLINYIERP